MEPERGEQRKFGGYCHWCWRLGHKQDKCWFKQEFEKYNGKGTVENQQAATTEPGQQDIRQYGKKRVAEESGDATQVGATTEGSEHEEQWWSDVSGQQWWSEAAGFVCGVQPEVKPSCGLQTPVPDLRSYDEDLVEYSAGQPYVTDGYIFPIQSSGQEISAVTRANVKPMVVSGAFISTCPPQTDAENPVLETSYKLRLESVTGDALEHYGFKEGVCYQNSNGLEMKVGFEVTNSMRPVLSVQKSCEAGQLTCFGPGICRIVKDPRAIGEIELILKAAAGFDILLENGAYVLDADLVSTPKTMAPVSDSLSSTDHMVHSKVQLNRMLNTAVKEQQADEVIKDIHQTHAVDAQLSKQIKTKTVAKPYSPTDKERDDHNKVHCPFRSWCEECIAGKSPESHHITKPHGERDVEQEVIPVIEFD